MDSITTVIEAMLTSLPGETIGEYIPVDVVEDFLLDILSLVRNQELTPV